MASVVFYLKAMIALVVALSLGLHFYPMCTGLLITVTIAALVPYLHSRMRSAKAVEYGKKLRVIVYGNHKGGVGKSTTMFYTIKSIAEKYKDQYNVLVIDASIYGDISSRFLGSRVSQTNGSKEMLSKKCTVEDMASASLVEPQFWEKVLRLKKPFATANHIMNLKRGLKKSSAPENLFLMTTRQQHAVRYQSTADEHMEFTNSDLSRISQSFRKSLAGHSPGAQQRGWLVFVDTDGGIMHGLTKVALAMADEVIIPLGTAPEDMFRLREMFQFMQTMKNQLLSRAIVTQAFFNRVVSIKNSEGTHLSPFKPKPAVQAAMENISKEFDEFSRQFPKLLSHCQSRTRSPEDSFFTTVREGGIEFARRHDDPFESSAGNAQADIDNLAERIVNPTTMVKPKSLLDAFKKSL